MRRAGDRGPRAGASNPESSRGVKLAVWGRERAKGPCRQPSETGRRAGAGPRRVREALERDRPRRGERAFTQESGEAVQGRPTEQGRVREGFCEECGRHIHSPSGRSQPFGQLAQQQGLWVCGQVRAGRGEGAWRCGGCGFGSDSLPGGAGSASWRPVLACTAILRARRGQMPWSFSGAPGGHIRRLVAVPFSGKASRGPEIFTTPRGGLARTL